MQMEALLEEKELWDIVIGTEPIPTTGPNLKAMKAYVWRGRLRRQKWSFTLTNPNSLMLALTLPKKSGTILPISIVLVVLVLSLPCAENSSKAILHHTSPGFPSQVRTCPNRFFTFYCCSEPQTEHLVWSPPLRHCPNLWPNLGPICSGSGSNLSSGPDYGSTNLSVSDICHSTDGPFGWTWSDRGQCQHWVSRHGTLAGIAGTHK